MIKNWSKYSKDHYLFILSQSEKKLDETVITMKEIQLRGRFQLLISLSLLTSVVGWCISEDQNNEYIIYAIELLIFFAISTFLCAFGIYRYKIYTKGTRAASLFQKEFYEPFIDNEELAEKNLILSECVSYSVRTESNKKINRSRLRLISYSFIIICSIPIVLGLTYIIC